MEEQNTISDVEYPTPVSYQQILPNPGIIRDNSDQLLDLLTKHIVERLQTRVSFHSCNAVLKYEIIFFIALIAIFVWLNFKRFTTEKSKIVTLWIFYVVV